MTQYKNLFKPTQIKLAVNACGELKIVWGGWSMGSCCPAPSSAGSILRPLCSARGRRRVYLGLPMGKSPCFTHLNHHLGIVSS